MACKRLSYLTSRSSSLLSRTCFITHKLQLTSIPSMQTESSMPAPDQQQQDKTFIHVITAGQQPHMQAHRLGGHPQAAPSKPHARQIQLHAPPQQCIKSLMRKVYRHAAADHSACSIHLVSPEAVKQHLERNSSLLALLDVDSTASVHIEELGEGKINHVYRLATGQQGSLQTVAVLKHAPPYVKSVGASFPLDQARLQVEARAMSLIHALCPAHVPRVLHYDSEANLMIMQYLPTPHTKVLQGVHQLGLTYPLLPSQLASLLSTVAVKTSLASVSPEVFQQQVRAFKNQDIVDANERVVLTSPMDADCPDNQVHTCPQLAAAIQTFRSDPVSRAALSELVRSYRTDKQALLHNDLHTGNLMATQTTLFCIDWEFATYGPVAFDLGCIIGVLLLAAMTLVSGSDENASGIIDATRRSQRDWLLAAVVELWQDFVQQHKAMLTQALEEQGPKGAHTRASLDYEAVFQDVAGFAAFAMFRLTAGLHAYPGYLMMEHKDQRAAAQLSVVKASQELLHLRHGRQASISNVVGCVKRVVGA